MQQSPSQSLQLAPLGARLHGQDWLDRSSLPPLPGSQGPLARKRKSAKGRGQERKKEAELTGCQGDESLGLLTLNPNPDSNQAGVQSCQNPSTGESGVA